MRTIVLVVVLAAPALARADLVLSLSRLGARCEAPTGFARDAAPPARLDLPALSLDGDAPVDAGGGDGMSRSSRAVLAFVLGIFPGFGIGHLVARSSWWPLWLVIDLVLLVVLGVGIFGPGWPGGYYALGVVVWLVERLFEGLHAHAQALGRRGLAELDALPESPAVASAAAPWGPLATLPVLAF